MEKQKMPAPVTLFVPEETVWEALRLDLVGDAGASDADFVNGLIVAAQARLERWIGHALADFEDAFPPELGQAISGTERSAVAKGVRSLRRHVPARISESSLLLCEMSEPICL
jgi:hypothetical protein